MRERNLHKFSSGKVRAVVATDVAARGIHVDNVDLVIHFDAASDPKAYLHRSGRTARAGKDGCVVTISTPKFVDQVVRLQRGAERRGAAPRPAHRPAPADRRGAGRDRQLDAAALAGGVRPQGGRSFSGGARKTYGGQGGGARRPEGRPDSRGEGARRAPAPAARRAGPTTVADRAGSTPVSTSVTTVCAEPPLPSMSSSREAAVRLHTVMDQHRPPDRRHPSASRTAMASITSPIATSSTCQARGRASTRLASRAP